MDRTIPRRRFLQNAGVATTAAAAAAFNPRAGLAAEQLAQNTESETLAPVPSTAPTNSAPSVDVSKFLVMHQIVKSARERMNPVGWQYVLGCADTETTMKRNRYALDSVAFKPRALRGVNQVDMRGKLLGRSLRLPVILSGVGSVRLIDPGGAATVAKAAAKFGIAMGYSSVARPGLEEVAAASDCPKIVQLYVLGDDDWVNAYAARAIKAGYTAFGFSIDAPRFSRRERDIINAGQNANQSDQPSPYPALTWDRIKRFKDKHKNVVVALKGITTGEDAELGLKAGASIIWVSTHGGRQCDHSRGAYEILPEVVQAVKGKATIIMDSGIYRGTDVVKALAAGADLAAIGRLYCYGLVHGEAGVVRTLEILEKEIETCMANLGAKDIAALNKALLTPTSAVTQPGLFSAFPLLDSSGFSPV